MGLFLDEARVASNLAHANIVQTLDLGLESDTLFIVDGVRRGARRCRA
jgi:hypothetical protein